MEQIQNVKKINLRIELEGNGPVNFDQVNNFNKKWAAKDITEADNKRNNNFKVIKGNYYFDGEIDSSGNKVWRKNAKISRQKVKKHAFDTEKPTSNGIFENITRKNAVLSHYATILGGIVKTKSNTEGNKKKSAIFFSDFEAGDNIKIQTEFKTNSNVNNNDHKTEDNKDKDDKNSTKIRNEETFGYTTYVGEGIIDLKLLQFICCDINNDMYYFNPDNKEFELFKKFFKINNDIDKDLEIKTYRLKNQKFVEYDGILFDNETIQHMVKWFLNQLINFNIVQSTGNAKIKKLELQFDNSNNVFEANNLPFVEIKNSEDIENIDFTTFYTYEETDELFN